MSVNTTSSKIKNGQKVKGVGHRGGNHLVFLKSSSIHSEMPMDNVGINTCSSNSGKDHSKYTSIIHIEATSGNTQSQSPISSNQIQYTKSNTNLLTK